MKKRLLTYYLPMLVITLLVTIIFRFISDNKDLIGFTTDVSGYIAIFFLVISLLIGPFNLLLKRRNPISSDIRRDIGIFGGALALVHSVVGLFAHFRGNMWKYFFKEVGDDLVMRMDNFGIGNYTGLIASLLIIVLLAISNNFSLTALKAVKWKNIQRLSYVMFAFTVVHSVYFREIIRDKPFTYSIYIFVFLVVLAFQLAGVKLYLSRKHNRLENQL